jgi:hypothetical protein
MANKLTTLGFWKLAYTSRMARMKGGSITISFLQADSGNKIAGTANTIKPAMHGDGNFLHI